MTAQSEEYEAFTQKVIAEFIGAEVFRGKTYEGRVSKREIVVDISFDYNVAGSHLLFLVECKCYARKVSVDEVEEFHSKIDDIGAHKGIMVTTVGYQSGAVKAAKGRGIALALLTKEPQPGELSYVVNSLGPNRKRPRHDGFWQGNFLGILDSYEGGLRFENMGQFEGMLIMDAMSKGYGT